MRIVCQQTILMKYHALFVIFEKAATFEIVVCCKKIGDTLRVNLKNSRRQKDMQNFPACNE